jgi:hypothetical protein
MYIDYSVVIKKIVKKQVRWENESTATTTVVIIAGIIVLHRDSV